MANMIDNEDMYDMHMCLVCHSTLVGLVNYINHKKYDCPGKRIMPPVTGSACTSASQSSQQQTTARQSSGNEMPDSQNNFNMNNLNHPSYSENYRNNLNSMVTHSGDQNSSTHSNLMSVTDRSAEGILKAAMIASGLDIPTTSTSLHNLAKSSASFESSLAGNSSALNSISTSANISVDINDSFSGLTSDMFSPGSANIIDPNIVMNSHNPEDFFSSLALQSKSSLKEQQISSQGGVSGIFTQVNFDKETSANVNDNLANDLPISNILNNLNFSDDEDMNFTFSDDDFFEEAFSDDSDDNSHPPRHHTSGKWKPGQVPPQSVGGKWKPGQRGLQSTGSKWTSSQVPRHHTGGKWKPGQGPSYSSGGKWKSSLSQNEGKLKLSVITSKGKKNGRKTDDGYFCKVCSLNLKNRFAYSSHCSSQKHKENVIIRVTHVGELVSDSEEITDDSILCKSCNVVLKNRFAYSSHCRSKNHRINAVGNPNNYEHLTSGWGKVGNVTDEFDENAELHEHAELDENVELDENEEVEENLELDKKAHEEQREEIPCEEELHVPLKNAEGEEISSKAEVTPEQEGVAPVQKDDEEREMDSEVQVKEISFEAGDTAENIDKDADSDQMENSNSGEELDNEEDMDGENTGDKNVKVEERKNKNESTAEQTGKVMEDEKTSVQMYMTRGENHFDSDTENEEDDHAELNDEEKINEHSIDENKEKTEKNSEDDDEKKNGEIEREDNVENIDKDVKDGTIRTPPAVVLVCRICDQKFYSKYVLARHFLSRFHSNRAKNNPDNIKVLEDYNKYIVRLSPFQCLVCRFYFNQESELIEHLLSHDHIQRCDDTSAPLFCTACKYASHWNSEIIAHLKNHKPHVEAMQKRNKPCIIKERHYQARCKYCTKVLHSHVHMKHHVRVKHGKDIYLHECVEKNICRLCGEQFRSATAMKLHVQKRHLTSGNTYCRVCNKILSGKLTYKRHMESEKHKLLNAKYQSIRNMSQIRKSASIAKKMKLNKGGINLAIQSKVKKSPSDDRVYKCEYCDFVAKKYADLRPHYIEKHSKHVLVCDVCDLTFISEKARKLHYASKQHQGNLDKSENAAEVMKCPYCPRKFNDEGLKNFHVEIYHAHPSNEDQLQLKLGGPCYTSRLFKDYFISIRNYDKSQKVTCPEKICGKDVKKENMLEHLRLHSGDKPFKCRYCSIGFISTSTLRRHITGHLGLQQRKCEICGKEYKKIASYREHMQQHELEKNQAQKLMCDVCGQSFYLKRQLQSHMRRHGERKFKCTVEGCHWTFYFATELNFHMRSHTREKPYLCDLCGYAAATKNRLLRHSRTHSGERLHHCEYCTYKAGTSTHLRRHMRIHIGCKPYKCPYCSYTCNTHENVRKHIMKTKKHSGLFIYPCKFCSFATNSVAEFKSHLMFNHSDKIEITSNDSMAQYTGLYQPQEDPRKPTEGMKINPIKERKQHFGKPRNRNKIKTEKQISNASECESDSEPDNLMQNGEHSYSRNEDEDHPPMESKTQHWMPPPPAHYMGPPSALSNVFSLSSQPTYYNLDGPQTSISAARYYGDPKEMVDNRRPVSMTSLDMYPKLVIDEFRNSQNKKTSHFGVNFIDMDNQ